MNTIPDTTEIVQQTEDVVSRANAVIVTSSETRADACEYTRGVKTVRKRIAEHFKPSIAAAYAAHKAAKKAMDDLDKPLADAEKILKGKLGFYDTVEERKRTDEEERLRAIARKQEEERRITEAERLEAEAEAKRAEAERALDEGKHLTAELKQHEAKEMTQAADATLAAPIPEPTVYVPTTVLRTLGVQTKQLWKHRVTNVALVPREYMIPDDKALAAIARAQRARAEIPGVCFYPEPNVAVSGYGR